MSPRTTLPGPSRRTATIGVVAVSLTVGGAAVAGALALRDGPAGEVTAGGGVADGTPNPAGSGALDATTTVPDEEAFLAAAAEYTQERSDAFWGAGYYLEDAVALAALWDVDVLEAKGRAGQLLIDGQAVPVAPGASLDLTDPGVIARLDLAAFGDAGYTADDGQVLAALWDVDVTEAKARAGRMVRDGQTVPVLPSNTPPPVTLGR